MGGQANFSSSRGGPDFHSLMASLQDEPSGHIPKDRQRQADLIRKLVLYSESDQRSVLRAGRRKHWRP